MENLRKYFQAMGFQGVYSLGLLHPRHVLIRFGLEEDYLRYWLRGVWNFQGFIIRTFKWSPSFSVAIESPFAPVWVSLPGLPIHYFAKGSLF